MSEKDTLSQQEFIHGRGAQIHVQNKFLKHHYVKEHHEGLDEEWEIEAKTQYFIEHPKKLVNKVESPDIGPAYSMNPYQGCEHGCIYCYARNTHEYYGFSAGLDFETKIVVKPNAAEVLKRQFEKPGWEPQPIMLAGNTDCYQPAERKFEITRKILQVCLDYKHPVGIITKNALITRDIDILQELARFQLVAVNVSLTTLVEETRQKMEPRTATSGRRLKVIEQMAAAGIPIRIMAAPMVPFINSHELPNIIKAAAEHGAQDAGYILVRLNGAIGQIFHDWVYKAFPDKADRVIAVIKETRGGKLNESRYGKRMTGEGNFAQSIADMYHTARKKYMNNGPLPPLRNDLFKVPSSGQLNLFDA